MRRNDEQLGIPGVQYNDTLANIQALTDVKAGMLAYATDQGKLYIKTASTWEAVGTGTGGGGDTVKISSGDTTSDYLYEKLIAGNNVYLDKLNAGGDEQIQITASGISGTKSIYTAEVLLDETVGVGGQASFDLQNISSGYSKFEIIFHGYSEYASATTEQVYLAINNDTTDANYYREVVSGVDTTPSAGEAADIRIATIATSSNSDMTSAFQSIIFNPSSSLFKNTISTVVERRAAGQMRIGVDGNQWESTAEINRLTLTLQYSSDFAEGSRCIILGYKEISVAGGGPRDAIYTKWDVDAPPETSSDLDDEFDDESIDAKWTNWDLGSVQAETETPIGLKLDLTSSNLALSGLVQAIPSGDFTIVAKFFTFSKPFTSYDEIRPSLLLLEGTGATDDIAQFFYGRDVTTSSTQVHRWSAYNSWNSALGSSSYWIQQGAVYLRIRRSSTTYYFDISRDGLGWDYVYSSTLWMTPTYFGIGGLNQNTGVTLDLYCDFFRYKNSSDDSETPVYGQLVEQGGIDPTFIPAETQDIFAGQVLLDQVAPSGGQANFDVTNISSDYSKINIHIIGKSEKSSTDADDLYVYLNNDTTVTNYRYGDVIQNGGSTSASHGDLPRIGVFATSYNSNMSGEADITIDDPGGVSYKIAQGIITSRRSSSIEWNGQAGYQWENTDAISRITLALSSGEDFAEGTRCTIIGYKEIKVANGGQGNSVFTDSYANRPSPTKDGNLFLPSDGFTIERDTGTEWTPWGPILSLATPPTTGWNWDNQGSATISTDGGVISMYEPADSGTNINVYYRTAPTPPYTISATFFADLYGVNYNAVGLCWRQSSDGKIVAFYIGVETYLIYRFNKWTNSTTFSAHYGSTSTVLSRPLWHLRLKDDNTNRTCSYSYDGKNWISVHVVGRTDFLTADQVGILTKPQSSSNGVGLTLISWKVE